MAAATAALPIIPKELIGQFVSGPMSSEAINAAPLAFKKALIQPALGAELGHPLDCSAGQVPPDRFLPRVAADRFGRTVPELHHALRRGRNQRVRSLIDHGPVMLSFDGTFASESFAAARPPGQVALG